MYVLFCAYREWAREVATSVSKHPRVSTVELLSNHTDLERRVLDWSPRPDVILLCGWSWPPSEKVVESKIPIFTEHPAASDRYSPGSPLQNQILDGIRFTKHRLVKVGFPELSLRQWSHEVDIDISGNMADILEQMTTTSKTLFNMFLDDYPNNVSWKTWDELPIERQLPRRTPEMSEITIDELSTMTTRQLFDKIRCLEHPYPNAFIEDDEGTLFFERVSYKSKTKK